MNKNRVEAFSDGVIAVIITILVLEIRAPHSADWHALQPLIPVFMSYVMTFVFLGIYWNNHHHLWHAVHKVSGNAMWANLHLLFWLSLTPFVTAWMGESHFATEPVAAYGFVLLMSAIAYTILVRALLRQEGADSTLARALGSDFKGKMSVVIYLVAIVVAHWLPWLAGVLYAVVAVWWLIPDRRIERVLT